MARLTLSILINAPLEEVYQYVTAFGKDGPVSLDAFQEKYGEILSQEGNVLVVEEWVGMEEEEDEEEWDGEEEGEDEEEADEEDESDYITWRCIYDYPNRRFMEAVDSNWADRLDQFRAARGGTRWEVQWRTKTGGVKGMLQYLWFLVIANRNYRRNILDPVRQHFKEQREG